MKSSYGSGSMEADGAYGGSAYGGYYQGYPPIGYPPINLPPVRPYPPDPYIDQYPLPEALERGTLFRWLYDPYENPYRE